MSRIVYADAGAVAPISSAPFIPLHNCKEPEEVVFTGDRVRVHTHWQRSTRYSKGRTLPCPGYDCPDCMRGRPYDISTYTPALVLTRDPFKLALGSSWRRVLYHLPDKVAQFVRTARASHYYVQRWTDGGASRIATESLGLAFVKGEKVWDPRKVLAQIWDPSEEHMAELEAMLRGLGPVVAPVIDQQAAPAPRLPNMDPEEVQRLFRERGAVNPSKPITAAGPVPKVLTVDELKEGHPVKPESKAKAKAERAKQLAEQAAAEKTNGQAAHDAAAKLSVGFGMPVDVAGYLDATGERGAA